MFHIKSQAVLTYPRISHELVEDEQLLLYETRMRSRQGPKYWKYLKTLTNIVGYNSGHWL